VYYLGDFYLSLIQGYLRMNSDINKSRKVAIKFVCENCKYKCCKQSDFNKHINTAKHINRINGIQKSQKSQKSQKTHACVCGKEYKYSRGLWEHKRKCSHNNNNNNKNDNNNSIVFIENPEEKPSIMDSMMEILSQNKELMNLLVVQNQEHKEETSKLHNTIQEMIPKIGNNNTTNNNTNQFNLQVFLNEDCKDAINFSEFIKRIQVSFEDIENQVESGYVKGISKLFIESLQGLGTNKRPIHCTDKKRKTLYIKENDEWDKEGSQDILKKGIQEVTRKTMITLMKEKENRADEYADMDSEFSEKCLYIQRNLIPTDPRETAFGKVMENITKNSGIIE